MTALLGVCDVVVPANTKTSYLTNKIGGLPDWPSDIVLPVPGCQVCGNVQTLVVQLYCCLDRSKYHRTLYLFACTNTDCWKEGKSWTVYRCQTEDCDSQQTSTKVQAQSETSKCTDDDWGVGANDWGVAADDWGEGADDWGEGADEWGSVLDDQAAGSNSGHLASDVNNSGSEPLASHGDIHTDCTAMEQLSIHDTEDNNDIEDIQTDSSQVVEEDMPQLSEHEKSERLQSFQVSSVTDKSTEKVFISYFINVFEEPDVQDENNAHISKLLKDYERREGHSMKDILSEDRFEGGGATEKYEKSALVHKDVLFHKFMKRLSLCPTQCVRYEWNGTPLFNSRPSSSVPSTCCHCGGELGYEFQLTPAIINYLRFPNTKEPALEFGTILVYTCKQSCWDATCKFRTEQVLVQQDPDQHFFK